MRRARAPKAILVTVGLCPFLFGSCTADSGGGGADGARLGEPSASLADDFGLIQTVRELPDGRALVADPLGNALFLVDFEAGTRTVVGQEGEGPGEYRQPDAVWPLPGGETLLIDLGNGRTQTIHADLTFGETSPLAMGEPRPGSALVLALPQGMDGEGNIYTRAMGGGMGGPLPDSAVIVRIDRTTMDVDTVASFKVQDRTRTTSGSGNNQSVNISPIPLSPEDAWGVGPDGAIALARSSDYHIEWIAPDGTVTAGPPTPFDAVSIGTAEKEEYVVGLGRSGGGVAISVMMSNGAMEMSFSRGSPGSGRQEIDQYTWPETKPPFYSGRLDVDLEGRVWVRRHVEAGADATYDLFDRDGERVGTVTFPPNKRVVGFGRGTVYVVAYDELDLNYLERHDLPST